MSIKKFPKNLKNAAGRNLRWLVFAVGLAALLFYGLAALIEKPAVETVTTPAPALK